jgi:hypothetical protein
MGICAVLMGVFTPIEVIAGCAVVAVTTYVYTRADPPVCAFAALPNKHICRSPWVVEERECSSGGDDSDESERSSGEDDAKGDAGSSGDGDDAGEREKCVVGDHCTACCGRQV